MATAAREVTRSLADPAQPDPHWNWQIAPRHGDTDAVTARAAWAQRVAWRLAHSEAWRAALVELGYFDPAYTYDEGHEYEADWTTDPHLGEDVRQKLLDEDGFVSPKHYKHPELLVALLGVLRALLGNRVEREPEVHFDPEYGARAGMRTEGGAVRTQVEPDLVVLPIAEEWPRHTFRGKEARTLRVGPGILVPELVVEILSPSTATRDLTEKWRLYADLGIAEYWTIDPGGDPEPDTPAVLRIHRLQPNGRYAQDPAADVYFSAVCGTQVRLREPAPDPGPLSDTEQLPPLPRFQWWDADRNRWRGREADLEFKLQERETAGEARGEAIGEMRNAIKTMHGLLDGVLPEAQRHRIAENWQRHGLPDDAVTRMLAVRDAPDTWPDLLEPDANTRGDRDDYPPPRDW